MIEITLSDPKITAFEFSLSDQLVDMTKPVRIVYQGNELYNALPQAKVKVTLQTGSQNHQDDLDTPMWWELDSIQCAVFGDCDHSIPSAVEKKSAAEQTADLSITAAPNPFNPTTTIRIKEQGARSKKVEIQIFDIHGKLIQKLAPVSLLLAPGISWDASSMPSGIYLVKARIGAKILTKQLVLIK